MGERGGRALFEASYMIISATVPQGTVANLILECSKQELIFSEQELVLFKVRVGICQARISIFEARIGIFEARIGIFEARINIFEARHGKHRKHKET